MARTARQSDAIWGLCLVALPVLGSIIFYFFPMALGLFNSFFKWNIIRPREFVGLQNYIWILLEDDKVIQSFWATIRYLLIHLPLVIGAGLFFALALNDPRLRGRTVFRTIVIVPWVTSPVAIGVVWLFFFNPNAGLLNSVLVRLFQIDPPQWFTNPQLAMGMLLTVSVWRGMGYSFIFVFAGLQTIPRELYESAMIDGASRWTQTTRITLPLLTPYLFLVTLLVLIGASQEFELPLILTDGKPDYWTQLINLTIYREAFTYTKMGYASAVATLSYLLVLSFTILQIRFQRRWVFYQGE
jgi:multiple sugar transport system permease protein